MTTEAVCERCGVFLPAGAARWCDSCGKRQQAELEVRRTARLMAGCLLVSGAVLGSIELAAAANSVALSAASMLLFGALSTGAVFAGAVVVLLRRRPGAGWAGVGVMLVSPTNWAFLTLGERAIHIWGRIAVLALAAALLGVAVGFKLKRQADALKR